MTRSATHVALRDLGGDRDPSLRRRESSDFEPLGGRVAMIKLKEDDVGLSAIYTRMRLEVFDE
ncbi:MAG TPA: hypothetical protein VM052_02725 [Candidatus Limnocylindrales bacterium]|nr:hypothetical protein [Candidatus Limnocylindrales bacterium]